MNYEPVKPKSGKYPAMMSFKLRHDQANAIRQAAHRAGVPHCTWVRNVVVAAAERQ